ncbi:iron-sulfur cluster repair di-iron protein [Cytophagales bacterium RKSG123]|nr:iron-sulfur cluster repair di-iron protein [Xanthovirga aplysinae]
MIKPPFKKRTIAELVTEDYRKAEVFEDFGIDFCCGGKKSLEEVCEKKNINEDKLMEALRRMEKSSQKGLPYNEMELDILVDHIINVHHAYVGKNIPMIYNYATKVSKVHGEANPENIKIAELFMTVASELNHHMMKEEGMLFPYIKYLQKAEKKRTTVEQGQFGSIKNPINIMEHEHESAGKIFEEIKQLSNQYTPPAHACNTYRVLYAKLQEFEKDLHHHIHLENNILFPKALALEKKLMK